MSFQLIGSGSDLNNVTSQMNANILELKNQESTKVIKDDTGVRRVLFGKGADGFYGLKISEVGIDVYDAGDSDLIFNSNNNVFKIVQTGTEALTVTDPLVAETRSTLTIPHNLGYSPAYMVYATVPADSNFFNDGQLTQLPTMLIDNPGSGGGLIYIYVQARADSTNLYIDVLNPGASNQTGFGNPWTFRYYLLQETAT